MKNPNPSDPIENALACVYEAAVNPFAWQGATERIADMLGADKAMLLVADWTSGSYSPDIRASHRVDDALLGEWQATYLPHDLWGHRMRNLAPNFVTTGAAVVDPAELRRSPFHTDLLAKGNINDVLSASLVRSVGHEVALSFYDGDLFQRSQMDLLERLAPHLRVAARLHVQVTALEQRASEMEDVVDRIGVAVITLGPDGRVMWANRRAERMLRDRDGLTHRQGCLGCTRPDDGARLRAALAAAAGAETGRVLSVSRRAGSRPLSVTVAPLSQRDPCDGFTGLGGSRRPAVVVTVSDPEDHGHALPERLRGLFGLTAAEASLAAALARDRTLSEYAEEAGITLNTARWTLKRVFEKTGCRRQSELVRLIVTSDAGQAALGPLGRP